MQPRYVPDGSVVMVTRRCLLRTKLMRPDRMMTRIYTYLLAWAAAKHGVKVIAATLMSTHEHLILQTPDAAVLADFMHDLHRMVAMCSKAYRKWHGAFWDHEQASVVTLTTPESLIEKLAYIMANPVTAHLTPHAGHWPGLNILPSQLGTKVATVRRPPHYLRADSDTWPETLDLVLASPDVLGLDPRDVREQALDELERLEADAHRELKRLGRRWLGVKKILRASPYERATSFEPLVKRNPTFAVGRHQPQAFLKAVLALRTFRHAYREALLAWRAGHRGVVFPAYTLAMRVYHAVRVAPA